MNETDKKQKKKFYQSIKGGLVMMVFGALTLTTVMIMSTVVPLTTEYVTTLSKTIWQILRNHMEVSYRRHQEKARS